MTKKNTPKRRRIAELEFCQPHDFIAATGYGNTRFHLDTKGVSLHVSPSKESNWKIVEEGRTRD